MLIVLLSSFSAFSQNSDGYAYYLKKSIFDLNNSPKNLNTKEKATANNMIKNLNKLEYKLSFNCDTAIFEELKKMDANNDVFAIKLARIYSGFNGSIFYDLKRDKIIHKKEVAGNFYLVSSTTRKDDWKLTKEKLIINSFICYKAIKKETIEGSWGSKEIEIIAWYSPMIPINFGPDGYAGLPGLIVQLEKGNVVTYLKKIIFVEGNVINKEPTKGKRISKKEFDSIMKKISLNRKELYSDD